MYHRKGCRSIYRASLLAVKIRVVVPFRRYTGGKAFEIVTFDGLLVSLVSPLYQFPNSNSQIYLQASAYNVTLLSYTHLAFLIRSKPDPKRLRPLWEVAKKHSSGQGCKGVLESCRGDRARHRRKERG